MSIIFQGQIHGPRRTQRAPTLPRRLQQPTGRISLQVTRKTLYILTLKPPFAHSPESILTRKQLHSTAPSFACNERETKKMNFTAESRPRFIMERFFQD